jgi:hypothetical protein
MDPVRVPTTTDTQTTKRMSTADARPGEPRPVDRPQARVEAAMGWAQAEPASRAACSNRLRYRSHQA